MLQTYDEQVATITKDRGAIYNHPAIDFARAVQIKDAVKDCPNPLARHVLEMLAVKMARLTTSPDHLDSWVDIAGYARTAVMCLTFQANQKAQEDLQCATKPPTKQAD